MLIHYIKLAGWRSIAPDHEVELADLGRVNLLIGPNNVGKSNVGRFLVWLRDTLGKFLRSSRRFSETLDIDCGVEEVNYWLRGALLIEAELGLDADAFSIIENFDAPAKWLLSDNGTVVRVRVRVEKGANGGGLSVVPIVDIGRVEKELIRRENKLLMRDGTYTQEDRPQHKHANLALNGCYLLATRILEIQALRNPSAPAPGQLSTNGSGIVAAIRKLKNEPNERAIWKAYAADLERWFKRLLDEPDVRIDLIDTGLLLELRRGDTLFDCELAALGSGVSELLMMLAFLRLKENCSYFVVVDEPEAHLHPAAVVELFRILTTHPGLRENQLLATSHSTALVDEAKSDWRLFRAYRAAHHGTAIEPLDVKGERALLADLGIRPSQLFLARVAIWVEGPSDVVYLSALLKAVSPQLLEGRDFGFVIYGGVLGTHLHLECEYEEDKDVIERLVKVLRISHRAVIVCDRDRGEKDDERKLISRLRESAKRVDKHAYVFSPPGREIEDIVEPEVLKKALKELPLPSEIGNPAVKIRYDDYVLNSGEPFDVAVSKAARRADDDKPLDEELRKRLKKTLSGRKRTLAKKVLGVVCKTERARFTKDAIEEAKRLVEWMQREPASKAES